MSPCRATRMAKLPQKEPKRTFDANSSRFGHMYAVLTKKYQKYPIFTYFALRPLIYAIWNLGHILQLKVKYTKVSSLPESSRIWDEIDLKGEKTPKTPI